MLNFYQMNLLLEEDRSIYTDPRVPPPPQYNFLDYMSVMTNPKAVNGVHEKPNNYDLIPLEKEDMMRYATPDYENVQLPLQDMELRNVQKLGGSGEMQRLGKSFTMGVRPQPSDEEFKKYTGMTW